MLLQLMDDEETKAQRGHVAESVTGRAWTPAQGIALMFSLLFTTCLSRKPCSSHLEGWPGFPVFSHLHTFLLSQSSPPLGLCWSSRTSSPQARCLEQGEQMHISSWSEEEGWVSTKQGAGEWSRESSWFGGYMAPTETLPSLFGETVCSEPPTGL